MTEENRQVFAKNLRHYMERYQKSQTDLVRDLDLRQATLSDWLNAKKFPRIDKIELLANYFRIEKSDLIEDKNRTKEDIELEEYVDQLHKRPEMKTLFELTKKATKEEVEQINNMIKAFKKD